MKKIIKIELDLPDDDGGYRFADVITILDTTLPYLADNVAITHDDR